MKTQKILLVPDVHAPYFDKAAWALLLKAGYSFKPDIIVTLGDFMDFYSVSSHEKNPNRINILDVEIAEGIQCRKDLDALGAKRKVFVEGNHCNRLERYLMEKAPELFNLVRVKDLLKLKENGWEFVPYKTHVKIGKLHITHEAGNCGQYAHYKAMETFQGNIVIGHTHRLGYAVVGNARGQAHVGAMFGWLGDFARVDYMHKVKALRDWAHGFGVGYLFPNGEVHLTPVPIVNHKCIVEGKVIKL